MNFWNWFGGMVRIRIVGADIASSLSCIIRKDISVFDSEMVDEITACITIPCDMYKKVQSILTSRGDKIDVIGRYGLYWKLLRLLKRPVLIVGVLVLFVLNIYLPGRIFFVQVEGNTTIPSRKILEAATQSGLGFGTLRREIRSEKIKNKLLEAIPKLQWIGVNTNGCVAVISVRERQTTQENSADRVVSSIVAARDGVIYGYTVTGGNAICKVGQAVKAGEILISGYTDCGFKIQATKAEGEVYAKTERILSLIQPSTWQYRTSVNGQRKKYSLILGKKRINLYNGSGISPVSCGKMYKETYISLPGGFVLPIAIVTETWMPCEMIDVKLELDTANDSLSNFAKKYLLQQMVAGQILNLQESVSELNGVYQLEGNYACLEMIGQVRKEEIYGKHE